MKYTVHDKQYRYKYYFDTETGFYMRTGILDENDRDTGEDPFMASFPHLIDVGIMGYCMHGESGLCKAARIQCYQSGYHIRKPDMTAADFERIAKECRHITNQIALGGRGDPNQHPQFERILQICRENDLVPNYTTSGFRMTDEQVRLTKQYCGGGEPVSEQVYRGCHPAADGSGLPHEYPLCALEKHYRRGSGAAFRQGICGGHQRGDFPNAQAGGTGCAGKYDRAGQSAACRILPAHQREQAAVQNRV